MRIFGKKRILLHILPGPYIHPSVNLTGIGRQDFRAAKTEASGESNGKPGLSAGRRSYYHQTIGIAPEFQYEIIAARHGTKLRRKLSIWRIYAIFASGKKLMEREEIYAEKQKQHRNKKQARKVRV
jgi:hypothetical protein